MQSRTLFPARVADTISATWVGRRLRASKGDDGFFLLESIVSIAIITIIMAALTAFFTDTVHTTDLQRSKQTAVQVADAAIDSLRALPATDLVTGRDSASVTAQFSAASSVVQPWITLALMSRDYDGSATAGAGANAVVPTSAKTTTLNGTAFKVSKYVGSCSAPIGNSSSCLSTNPTGSGYVAYVRGVVAVEWPDSRCPSSTCTYVTATLITKSTTDPTFNLNQSPTPAPVAVSPGNQTSVVGDQISGVQLTMKAGTGVPTATWTTTSTLPAGITLNPDGTFSGSPTAATCS